MYKIIQTDLMLYRVTPKYIDALQDEANGGDSRVYNVRAGKEHRPFVGVITVRNGQKYCVPLSKYKPKYKVLPDNETLMRIYIDGKIVGALQFSRMIPVEDAQLRPLDMAAHPHDTKNQKAEKELRVKETIWCHQHQKEITDKCTALYDLYISNIPFRGRQYCLNFPEMENVCRKYNKTHIPQHHKQEKDNDCYQHNSNDSGDNVTT